MAYINSNNISVFPTSGRPTHDPWGRLTTEYNLTSLINTLLNVDGFVITDPGGYTSIKDENNNENNYIKSNDAGSNSITQGRFQFNIKGYIFTIFDINTLITQFSTENAIYANLKIKIEDGSSIAQTAPLNGDNDNKLVYHMQSIEGGDNNGSYQGVTFTSTAKEEGYISLKILEKRSDEKWYIPDESKIKFRTNKSGSQRSVTIDDGEIS